MTERSLWSWASRLKRADAGREATMRWAKVEAQPRRGGIVIRVGAIRIAVDRGFDAETLSAILTVLDGRRL